MKIDTFAGFIAIAGTADANPKMLGWLSQLKGTGVGSALLTELGRLANGQRLILIYRPLAEDLKRQGKDVYVQDVWTTHWKPTSDAETANTAAGSFDRNTETIGTGSLGVTMSEFTISWDESAPNGQNPGAALIGHEMIHVLHGLKAEDLGNFHGVDKETSAQVVGTSVFGNMEESRTIGLREDGYFGEYFSENSIRSELGAPLRSTHDGLPGDAPDFIHPMYVDRTPWPVIP